MRPPLPPGDPTRRTIDAARIRDLLLCNGWAYELQAGRSAVAETEADAALERLVALGLPYSQSVTGSNPGGRLFDPVEVGQFLYWAAEAHGDRLFEDHYVAHRRRRILEAPSGRDPLGYGLTLRRTFNLAGRVVGSRVRLALPLPLEDAMTRDVAVEFLPDPEAETEARSGAASLDVQATVPGSGRITIGLRATFTVEPPPTEGPTAPLDPAEAALYTRLSEGPIKASDRVVALAARLAGDETDSLAILRRFWLFMMEALASGPVDYGRIDPQRPVDFVLEDGWYDCRGGASLVVSLCRARNIPARLVSGYCLYPIEPSIHSWFEAWVDGRGWLPFDLICADLSLGGRDVAWRDLYFGQVTERLALERPPRLFTGASAIRLPRRWHLLSRIEGEGVRFDFHEVDSGALIYSDLVAVARGV